MTTTATHRALDHLIDTARGPVLVAGDDRYDAERAGFQAAVDHRPAVVVGATCADDVRAAVRFAAANDLPVAVQATGHGPAGAVDGGVLISTRRMRDVRVDPERGTARLEAGVRSGDVVDAAAPHGLAPLSGGAPHVGAVGYTLGGGIGLLARRYGYAADHVHGIEVVTAEGRLRHVSADDGADLFWALRGGRDNFGVVTALEVGLVPVTRLYGGGLYFDADLAAGALHAYVEWTRTLPDAMTSSLALVPFPDMPQIPEPLRGRFVTHVRIAFTGGAAEGEALVAPLRALGPRLLNTLGELPYTAGDSIHHDPTDPMPYTGTNVLLDDLDADAPERVLELAGPGAPDPCIVELRHLGGALARPPATANAVGHRDAQYLLAVLSKLPSGADPAPSRAVQGRLLDALAPWTRGRSLNFLGHDGGARGRPRDLRPRRLPAARPAQGRLRPGQPLPPGPHDHARVTARAHALGSRPCATTSMPARRASRSARSEIRPRRCSAIAPFHAPHRNVAVARASTGRISPASTASPIASAMSSSIPVSRRAIARRAAASRTSSECSRSRRPISRNATGCSPWKRRYASPAASTRSRGAASVARAPAMAVSLRSTSRSTSAR